MSEYTEARIDLLAAAMYGHSRAEAEELIDDFERQVAEKHAAILRVYPDYRGVMDLAAALVLGEDHPHRKQDVSASPVRPDEEPTP